MVTVRRQQPDELDARDWHAWLEQLNARVPVRDPVTLERACQVAERCERAGEAAGEARGQRQVPRPQTEPEAQLHWGGVARCCV